MLKRWLGYPSVQIVLCTLVFAGLVWWLGPFGAVIASPLLAAAIARPIINLVGNLRQRTREATWLPVHGVHFVFKGTKIHVIEDDDHCRWVRLADMRKIDGITANESALAMTYPGKLQSMGRPVEPYLRDDALVEHLGKQGDAVALRFRTWADRTIAFPAGQVRKRLGIRPDPPIA